MRGVLQANAYALVYEPQPVAAMVVPFHPLAPLAAKAEGWEVSFTVSCLLATPPPPPPPPICPPLGSSPLGRGLYQFDLKFAHDLSFCTDTVLPHYFQH